MKQTRPMDKHPCSRVAWLAMAVLAACGLLAGCGRTYPPTPFLKEGGVSTPSLEEEGRSGRPGAVKMAPANDPTPPRLHSSEFKEPVPLPAAINTSGAEDSPFILPDGNTLYFFYTPDPQIPAEKQVTDGETGIYVAHRVEGAWQPAERVWLQDPGKLSLDGCEFILGERLWFCSIREGYEGLHWFTADLRDGTWQIWRLADFPLEYQVGELHISNAGTELYFHSQRPGGLGGLDLWLSRWDGQRWGQPVNLAALNTPDSEGWPALSPDETELWFYRNYGLWRAKKIDGEWGAPELIVDNLAGEATLDAAGNLYFVHHYFVEGKMVEADIYLAERR